jgi:hypothetical protein
VAGLVGVARDAEGAVVVAAVVVGAQGDEVPELSLICPSW